MTVNELIFEREGHILGRVVDLQEWAIVFLVAHGIELVFLVLLFILVVKLHARRR